MKRFIKDVLLYAIPLMIVGIIFLMFGVEGYLVGEFKNLEYLIEKQDRDHSVLVGWGYNEQTPYYKLLGANYYQADVIALGTSRAMQFKGVYFKSSFYNIGGGCSGNYDEYKNFLQNLNYTPKIMLLDLDAWVFNAGWNWVCEDYSEFKEIKRKNRNIFSMTKTIVQDYVNGKWDFDDLALYANNEGFNGKVKDTGFMYDGSYYYGFLYRYPEESTDYQFVNTLSRIEEARDYFEYGEHVDQNTLEQLESLLQYCQKNEIYVIGYLAPFAPRVYKTMAESGNYGYLEEISPACRELFEKYGFAYFDYGNGAELGVTDAYFVDGFHGSDVVYGLMVEDMIKSDETLASCINDEKLEELLANAFSEVVFENPDTRSVYK